MVVRIGNLIIIKEKDLLNWGFIKLKLSKGSCLLINRTSYTKNNLLLDYVSLLLLGGLLIHSKISHTKILTDLNPNKAAVYL